MLGTLIVLSLGACAAEKTGNGVATAGNGAAKPASSASAGPGGDDAALKYSACVRANGVPNFPDPNPQGGLDLDLGKLGVSKETMDAADAKCKQYLPNGGRPQKIDPAKLALAREYSKCMRANGVPKFPDPDAYGGIALDGGKLGVDPVGSTMKAAEKACQKYLGDGGGQLSSRTG
ncbi:hypothetical protein ODJ79_30145 [Actinoplanes sp. KI2]|uniref:hypothetical protein n=1 Tax=Actinoplanes sp. KI2 TaxID=2983315 RepID=UPI0021D58A3D|nr:hypothetical protein [Actinoplanes sp. KI2]MCU7728000.1 hypothetical protein [Actinoplanes sp. KI2]